MKTFKEQKWMVIVYGIVLLIVGLIDLILSIVDLDIAIEVVSYSIAGGLFIIGFLHILTNLIQDTKSFFRGALVLGCIAIAVGVVFIVYPKELGYFLVYLVPSFVIAISAVFVVKGVLGCKYNYKKSWIIFYFAVATVGITLSILSFVYMNKSDVVVKTIYISMGAIASAIGVATIVYGVKLITKKSEE